MKKYSKISHKNQLVKLIGVFVFIIFFILILNSDRENPVMHDSLQNGDEEWVFENGKTKKTINPPDVIKSDAHQTYSVSRKISEELPEEPTIVFRSRQEKVKVFVDEKLIYKYPEKPYFADIVPGNWNFVAIPEDAEGKNIRIEFESPYRYFAGRIGEIHFGSYNALLRGTQYRQLWPFLFNLFIGVIGCSIFIVSLLMRRYRRCETEEILGILLIFVSVWLCGESGMPVPFIDSITRYFITFISLMMAPICFTAYMSGWSKMV